MEYSKTIEQPRLILLAWLLCASPLTLHLTKGGVFSYALLGYGLWVLLILFDALNALSFLKLFLLIGIILSIFFSLFSFAIFWQLILFSLVANEKLGVSISGFVKWYAVLRILLPFWALVYLVPFLFLPLPQNWFTTVFFLLPLVFMVTGILQAFPWFAHLKK